MNIKDMTLKQKLGQMTQLLSENLLNAITSEVTTGKQPSYLLTKEEKAVIGSTLNCIKKEHIEATQNDHLQINDIPLLFMADVIHGFRTIFPIPLAQASCFDANFVRKISSVCAYEAKTEGLDVTFSPMCDLSRDPRWGRVMEGYGEDTYLASVMVKATINGYHDAGLLSCIKHFATYSYSESGRDYNNAELSESTLWESVLPVYKAGIDAGCDMVMSAFNTYDGIPMTCNKRFLKEILRCKWNFNGPIISDYNAVLELISHGAAKDEKEAAELSLTAGIDIEMMTMSFMKYGERLIKEGLIDEEDIDKSTERILNLKTKAKSICPLFYSAKEIMDLEIESASKCTILLKNKEHLLPLRKTKKIAIIGPYARERKTVGGWSLKTIEGLSLEDVFKNTNVAIIDYKSTDLINKLRDFDNIIFAIGEKQEETGEATSKTNLSIDESYIDIARCLSSINKKIILIVFAGRPLILGDIEPYCYSILYAWFPGSFGTEGIKRLIYGEALPEAKVPMSFPRTIGQIPIYYEQYPTGRPLSTKDDSKYQSKYIDCQNSPLYPFGYGLTYGECKITGISILPSLSHIEVTISNIANYEAKETIQIYIYKRVKGISRRIYTLKNIKKVLCKPKSTTTARIELTKEIFEINIKGNISFYPGTFSLYIGFSSNDLIKTDIELNQEEYEALPRN